MEGAAYLGHEAKLFSQIHQPDEISLGRFRPVTRRQSPPPATRHVDGPCAGGKVDPGPG